MSIAALSRLNPVTCIGFERIIAGKRVAECRIKSFIPGGRRFFFSYSGLSHLSPCTSRLVTDSSHCHLRSPSRGGEQAMAASGSMLVFGDIYFDDMAKICANSLDSTKPWGAYLANRNRATCQRASMNLLKTEQANCRLVCRCFMADAFRRNSSGDLHVRPLLRNVHTSSSPCLPLGQDHDLSLGSGSQDEELKSSPVSSLKNLKLLSGSCYLPHPAKEETGGEDAHFICDEEQAIGVADGVGGWAEVGVNAGLFARELMSNSVAAIQELPKGSIDPLTVLEKAHSGSRARGSSTACIITLTDQGVHAINLGDSGFIVVRDGSTVFHSPVQQHGFNFTYQLESGSGGDMPSSGQVFTIAVETGDVIVAGTDGLFDNLYNNEISGVVVNSLRAHMDPKGTAQNIAALARQRAMDRKRQTPFSAAAQEAGFWYYGGKLDDITVVVSYITSSSET